MSGIYDSDFNLVLGRRLGVLIPGMSVQLHTASKNLKFNISKLCMSHKLMILRSVLHSWATSYRYHEVPKLVCVFGCSIMCPRPANDSPCDNMEHYLMCPILWKIVGDAYKY